VGYPGHNVHYQYYQDYQPYYHVPTAGGFEQTTKQPVQNQPEQPSATSKHQDVETAEKNPHSSSTGSVGATSNEDADYIHTQQDSFPTIWNQPPPVVGGVGDHSFIYMEKEDGDGEGSATDDAATEYQPDDSDENEAGGGSTPRHDKHADVTDHRPPEDREGVDLLKLSQQGSGPLYWK